MGSMGGFVQRKSGTGGAKVARPKNMQGNKPTKAERLKWALDYLGYCEHMGVGDSDIDGLTDEEIIEKADAYEEKGEAAYDAWKERFNE